jgi:hypothetical protein
MAQDEDSATYCWKLNAYINCDIIDVLHCDPVLRFLPSSVSLSLPPSLP